MILLVSKIYFVIQFFAVKHWRADPRLILMMNAFIVLSMSKIKLKISTSQKLL